MLTVMAPAKINITLETLGKCADGYHEIRSVMQAVSLCDSLAFEPAADIKIHADLPEWQPEKSLVAKTASLLRAATGAGEGAGIFVQKRIPLMSGLGGDSSDAAATLCGLNRLWGLDLPRQRLVELARQLGSDVAFFLYGGTALAAGRGEIITPLPDLPPMPVIVALPDVPRQPGKTARLYASLQPNHYTDGALTQRVVDELRQGRFAPESIFNTFENVVFTPGSPAAHARAHITKIGGRHVHLAGSGPALFTMMPDKAEALDLFERLRKQNLALYLAETLPGAGC